MGLKCPRFQTTNEKNTKKMCCKRYILLKGDKSSLSPFSHTTAEVELALEVVCYSVRKWNQFSADFPNVDDRLRDENGTTRPV